MLYTRNRGKNLFTVHKKNCGFKKNVYRLKKKHFILWSISKTEAITELILADAVSDLYTWT